MRASLIGQKNVYIYQLSRLGQKESIRVYMEPFGPSHERFWIPEKDQTMNKASAFSCREGTVCHESP